MSLHLLYVPVIPFRYLGWDGRDSPRTKVDSFHANNSLRDISGAMDNFVDRAHALHSYQAPLPETSQGRVSFSQVNKGQFHP